MLTHKLSLYYLLSEDDGRRSIYICKHVVIKCLNEEYFLIEGGLYSVTALRETWARRRCILNTGNYH